MEAERSVRVALALSEQLELFWVLLGQRAPHFHHGVFESFQVGTPFAVEVNGFGEVLLHPGPHGSAEAKRDEELLDRVSAKKPARLEPQPSSNLTQDLVAVVS